MSYLLSRLALWVQVDFLTALGLVMGFLVLFALARQYYLHFATPPAIRVQTWVPIPEDLPTEPVAPYGAASLKASYKPNLFWGMNGSVTFHAGIIVTFLVIAANLTREVVDDHRIVDSLRVVNFKGLGDPNPLHESARKGLEGVKAEPMPPPPLRSTIPIPVPDSRALPSATVLSAVDLQDQGIGEKDGTGIFNDWFGGGGGDGDPNGDPNGGPGGFGAPPDDVVDLSIVEQQPEMVTIPEVVYPVNAREAKVEGVVELSLLVGKNGHVREVRIKRSIPMLDGAARTAAEKAVFRPALWKNKPVNVWVTVPIRFTLKD